MVRKVAIYTRVSTLDQTIDNQLIELRDHCSRMEWEVVKEYSDKGLSGLSLETKDPHSTLSSRTHTANGLSWWFAGISLVSDGQ